MPLTVVTQTPLVTPRGFALPDFRALAHSPSGATSRGAECYHGDGIGTPFGNPRVDGYRHLPARLRQRPERPARRSRGEQGLIQQAPKRRSGSCQAASWRRPPLPAARASPGSGRRGQALPIRCRQLWQRLAREPDGLATRRTAAHGKCHRPRHSTCCHSATFALAGGGGAHPSRSDGLVMPERAADSGSRLRPARSGWSDGTRSQPR